MNIQTYLNLYELLKHDTSTKEQRRAFALQNKENATDAHQQLLLWIDDHIHKLSPPTLANRYLRVERLSSVILSFLALFFGFIAAGVVLHYNGTEPVNVIYFLFLSFFIPVVTMLFSIFAMLKQEFFIHISLTYIVQKIFLTFQKEPLDETLLDGNMVRWLFITKMQMTSLLFAIGVELALLLSITTQDIAFAWSTTLDISPQTLHCILSTLALPWSFFLPSAVPSLELIEHSHYFRLGGQITQQMLENVSELGGWWKFLAMETFVYAILLRVVLYIVSSIELKKSLQNSMLHLPQAQQLLQDMNEPIITTKAMDEEKPLHNNTHTDNANTQPQTRNYDAVLGYAFGEDEVLVISEALHLNAEQYSCIGGNNSLDEDEALIETLQGDVAVILKAWEVPTMDFIDFIDTLVLHTDTITLYPVGYAKNNYQPYEKDTSIWQKKLASQNYTNVKVSV